MMPDAALIARFRDDLSAVWPLIADRHARLGIAVSGGPDSVALLLLAHAALPGRVEAATVDHGLRAESADEAAMVARLCQRLGIAHRTLPVDVATGNVQEQARIARYTALGAWYDDRGLDGLATAHHLDDQAETLMMRLNRGSGLTGLAGIRRTTGIPGHGGRLIRPVLDWCRADLAQVVAQSGIEPVADPSNTDNRFDRARIRKALADADWIDPAALARSAQLLAQADDAVQFMVGREHGECVRVLESGARYHALRSGLGAANLIRIGVIQSIFRQLGSSIDAAAAAALIDRLIAGQGGNVAGIQGRATDVDGERVWDFQPENPRRS